LLVRVEGTVVMMVMDLEQEVVLVELVPLQYQTHKHKVNHLSLE
tara:strand:- start:547 stop:678 length:132 start_codon:yes stop_codon:yes gene_type:complete